MFEIRKGSVLNFVGAAIINSVACPLNEDSENGQLYKVVMGKAGKKVEYDLYHEPIYKNNSLVLTESGDLPNVKFIMHAIVPKYSESSDPDLDLYKIYADIGRIASKYGFKSIGIPLLGWGVNKYPSKIALETAIKVLSNAEDLYKLNITLFVVNDSLFNEAKQIAPDYCKEETLDELGMPDYLVLKEKVFNDNNEEIEQIRIAIKPESISYEAVTHCLPQKRDYWLSEHHCELMKTLYLELFYSAQKAIKDNVQDSGNSNITSQIVFGYGPKKEKKFNFNESLKDLNPILNSTAIRMINITKLNGADSLIGCLELTKEKLYAIRPGQLLYGLITLNPSNDTDETYLFAGNAHEQCFYVNPYNQEMSGIEFIKPQLGDIRQSIIDKGNQAIDYIMINDIKFEYYYISENKILIFRDDWFEKIGTNYLNITKDEGFKSFIKYLYERTNIPTYILSRKHLPE